MSCTKVKTASVSRKRADNRSLLEYANQNRDEGFFNDVYIKVGNECFPANRMVLSCFSRVFERMFKVEMKERYEQTVEVKQVDEKSMKILIDYIYTGHIDIDNENVMDLLSAADYLELEEVKKFCFEFLISILAPDTWYAILTAADLYRNEPLKCCVNQYLTFNLDQIIKSNDFESLSKEDVLSLFDSLDRFKIKESSIYQAFIAWTKADEGDRKMKLSDLLQWIKFDRLSAEFCDEVISKEDLILQNVECLKFLCQAFSRKLLDAKRHGQIISFGGTHSKLVLSVYSCCREEELLTFPNMPGCDQFGYRKSLKLNDFVFSIGGTEDGLGNGSVEVWKINLKGHHKQWQQMASLNEGRGSSGAAVFGGKLVVAGGHMFCHSFNALKSVEVYSDESNDWNEISPMNEARYGTSLVNCDGSLYAVGGVVHHWHCESNVERLSGLESEWKYVKAMQARRIWHAAVSCNGCVYALGGKNRADKKLKSVEKYDPLVDEWSYVSDMSTERSGLAACVMNGKIYVVGGEGENGKRICSIDCYNPINDSWKCVGETSDGMVHHSILAL